jgi:hypothetical protein
MKRFLGLIAVILVSVFAAGAGRAQVIPNGHYLGQSPPGFAPMVFAPGILSLPDRYEYCITFSPSLDECVFGVTDSAWGTYSQWYTKMGSDSTWVAPVPAPFQGEGEDLNSFYSADGNQIYFISYPPATPPSRIWRSTREGAGWSEALPLDPPVNNPGSNQWGGSLTDDGTLYFCSTRAGGSGRADLHRAVTGPGGEVTVENLGAVINSQQNDGDPCVARDGSYIIFASWRAGGLGQSDLYISFNESGAWTTPRNLGYPINSSSIEDWPSMSPDGKYLFFNRRKSYVTNEQTEIWWVDARAVFHPEESGVKDPGGWTGNQVTLQNEPNPFAASTTITYSTPAAGFTTIKVYDVLGREVQSLVHASLAAGTHSVAFYPPRGDGPSSGIYYCSLLLGDKRLKTTKMVSLR